MNFILYNRYDSRIFSPSSVLRAQYGLDRPRQSPKHARIESNPDGYDVAVVSPELMGGALEEGGA